MELKKGVYFTIDSIIGASLIILAIILALTFYSNAPETANINFLSSDTLKTLSAVETGDSENEYIKEKIDDGTITNLDNTILEQIGEFWAEGNLEEANRTAANVTEPWIPDNYGHGIWINNQTIYSRDKPIKSTLVSHKKLVSGIKEGSPEGSSRDDPPTLWGPAIMEVRVWR